MRSVLPSSADARRVLFQAQRKKNLIPSYAALTKEMNLEIMRSIAEEEKATSAQSRKHAMDRTRDLLDQKRVHEAQEVERIRSILENALTSIPTRTRLAYSLKSGREITHFAKPTASRLIFDRYISNSMRSAFKTRSPSRDTIIRVATNTLLAGGNNASAKYGLIGVDVKDFYKEIDHSKLIERLQGNGALPSFAAEYIQSILNGYEKLHGRKRGIPEGVPSSSMLAEIYLERLDEAIKMRPDVVVYLRYVDDILIVVHQGRTQRVIDAVESRLREVGLELNHNKQMIAELPATQPVQFDYLGYSFRFSEIKSRFEAVDISRKKEARYLAAIDNLRKYASNVECWARVESMDTFLAACQYLLLPHVSRSGKGQMRIVSGLAYSSRLILLAENYQDSRIDKLCREVIRSQGLVWRKMSKSPVASKSDDVYCCNHCGKVVQRLSDFREFFKVANKAEKIMRMDAMAHLPMSLRRRAKEILWK